MQFHLRAHPSRIHIKKEGLGYMGGNTNLTKAKAAKNDEFYTRLGDIEAEISCHPDYVRHFKDKVVFCNCDDPEQSNFFVFFRLHFRQLGLKKLITTHYNKDGSPSYKIEWSGEMLGEDTINMIITPLEGNGDFRSEECIELMKEADIIVTNPPFSLFRSFVAQLMMYDKKFIIIGNVNAITYKEIFPLIKDEKMWPGYTFNKTMLFRVGEWYQYNQKETDRINDGNKYGKVPGICWFTNLDIDKRHEDIPLTKNYHGNEDQYPKYDNYDAINVDKVKDIPKDYFGHIGVPVTYMDSHNPKQFTIIDANEIRSSDSVPLKPHGLIKDKEATVSKIKNGIDKDSGTCDDLTDRQTDRRTTYARIVIKRRM